ncbi:MAG: IS1595 family transposase [Thermodesulfobacteriota bacterium]|nr:IS1595 family transposase [Thermodesulfobacteriota bacterium]
MGKNKYIKNSKISEARFRSLVKLFVLDLTATQISAVLHLNRNTVNRYLLLIRRSIHWFSYKNSPLWPRSPRDESDTCLRDILQMKQGIKGRPLSAKTLLIGIRESDSNVFTELVHDSIKHLILAALRGKVDWTGVQGCPSWPGYWGLVHVKSKKLFLVGAGRKKKTAAKKTITATEHFWAMNKERFARLRGVKENLFLFHLKEWEFRYNYRNEDIYKLLLKIIRNTPGL